MINVYNQVYHKEVSRISREAEHFLLNYLWPGNIRELKNTVKSIIPFKTTDTIESNDLSTSIMRVLGDGQNKLITLEENESEYILKVLKITDFNITRTAEILGVTRGRVYRKINHLDLGINDEKMEVGMLGS